MSFIAPCASFCLPASIPRCSASTCSRSFDEEIPFMRRRHKPSRVRRSWICSMSFAPSCSVSMRNSSVFSVLQNLMRFFCSSPGDCMASLLASRARTLKCLGRSSTRAACASAAPSRTLNTSDHRSAIAASEPPVHRSIRRPDPSPRQQHRASLCLPENVGDVPPLRGAKPQGPREICNLSHSLGAPRERKNGEQLLCSRNSSLCTNARATCSQTLGARNAALTLPPQTDPQVV